MKLLRIYVDTSVIGGCLDDEFADESNALLAMARDGKCILLISTLLLEEIRQAPEAVKTIFETIPPERVETLRVIEEANRLRDEYLKAAVLGPSSAADALHVAMATVFHADMIVSWNFKHIVHFDKMRGFNAVNIREGYAAIEIHSPKEVV